MIDLEHATLRFWQAQTKANSECNVSLPLWFLASSGLGFWWLMWLQLSASLCRR